MRHEGRRRRATAVGLLLSFATPTVAQTPPSPLSPNECVLHVWPAETARSSYVGWFHGGAVNGDRRGIKGYPASHADALSTAAQHELLSGVQWASAFDKPALKVVVHDAPPPDQDELRRTEPLIAERPNCYDELIVHSVAVENAVFTRRSVRLMVVAKKWRGTNAVPQNYSTMASAQVVIDETVPGAADRSLQGGYYAAMATILKAAFFIR